MLENGTLLKNRYRVEQAIAKGGMGAIYFGTDETLGIRVAIKENLADNTESIRQFHREATILASLRHPALPRVTDHFVLQDQGQYLIMDYIEGEDLQQRIERLGKISEEEACAIGITICDALNYLHTIDPPVIHRDIKPGNIKITPQGQIYLVDFGLAKISQTGKATTVGAQALTPGFAPPEQYGEGTEPRSDIYALGATLYAALSSKTPADGLSLLVGTAHLLPLRELNPTISPEISTIIEKALETDINRRFLDAKGFQLALEHCAVEKPRIAMPLEEENGPAKGLPATSPQEQITIIDQTAIDKRVKIPPAKPVKRSEQRWLIPGILGLIVMIGFGALGYTFLIRNRIAADSKPTATETAMVIVVPIVNKNQPPARLQTPDIVPQSTSAAMNTDLPLLSSIIDTATAFLPSPTVGSTPFGGGSGQIAFASDRGGGIPQIWLMDADGGNLRQITRKKDGACQPSWSPDAKRLVFTSPCPGLLEQYKGSSLFLVDLDGKNLTPLPIVPGGDFDPAWCPNRGCGIIAFTSLRKGLPHIFTYDLQERRYSDSALTSKASHDNHPAWSPDGELLAFESTRGSLPQIWVMSSLGENPEEFSVLANGYGMEPAWAPDGKTIIYTRGTDQTSLVSRQYPHQGADEYPVSLQFGVSSARYSTDGIWIIYVGKSEGKHAIYRMLGNGSEITRLTQLDSNNYHPAWKP